MRYTLQYINDCGDTIARDYFYDKKEALEFMGRLIHTYKSEGVETGLILVDSDGNLVAEYYTD